MSQLDPALLRRLLDEHGPALALYARQWCSVPEDIVQEAMMKLVQQRQVPEDIVPWLFRVVRNEAINHSRSSHRRQRRESATAPPEQWFANVDEQLDGQFAAEALAGLPVDIREIVVARIWGGLTLREVAQVCGSSISTVQRRYEEGLGLLRQRLGIEST